MPAFESLGAERLVYVTLGEALFTARLDATAQYPKIGDLVNIAVSPDHMHWFDAGSSARVSA